MKDTTKIKDLPGADCFSLEQLFQFVDRNMPDEKLRHMEKHIEVCDFCADAVSGYKKVDKMASKHALVDIAKRIQQKTGVEEGEVIIKPDYRIAIAIGACLVLLIGVYGGIQIFSDQNKEVSENENSQTVQPLHDSSNVLAKVENIVEKDSISVVDSTKGIETAMAASGLTLASGTTGSTMVALSQNNVTGELIAPTGAQTIAAPPIAQGPRKYPQFPGGEKSLGTYISTNRKYPQEAREKGIHGFVKVGFTLDENGKVVKTRIIKGIGGGCDEEAARLFMSMPNWTPANDGTKNLGGEYVWDVEF